MKKLTLIIYVLTIVFYCQAKVITVDNNGGSGADYDKISSAISNASNGDSIYVHPSATNYGDFSINKEVYLLGPGHYPEGSGYLTAKIKIVTLRNGCNGTKISGFYVTGQILTSVWNVASDITIENNYFSSAGFISGPYGDNSDGDNWIIRGNVFEELTGCGGCKLINVNSSALLNDNWLIANNIIISKATNSSTYIFQGLNSNTVVINNTILHNNSDQIFSANHNSDVLIKNNIVISAHASLIDVTTGCTNCSWENNITYSPSTTLNTLPGINNIDNTDPKITNVAVASEWSYDNDYNVDDTSPARNTGSDGTDIGAYGANFNFSKFGYPFGVPIMQQLFIENQLVTQGEPLRFRIKARSAESRITGLEQN